MKRIYFIRHAKAIHDDVTLDFKRDLTKRGEKDAKLMSKVLKKTKIDKFFASPSKRTLKTAQIIATELEYDNGITTNEVLYASSVEKITNYIKCFNDVLNEVALVGHNYEIMEVCECLTNTKIEKFPTTAICCIDFDISSWKDLHEGKMAFLKFPSQFK